MTYYTSPFQQTAKSAFRTAQTIYDTGRAIATHPRTVRAAQTTIWMLYIGAVVAFALGQTARIAWNYARAKAALEKAGEQPKCLENPTPTPQSIAIAPCSETGKPQPETSAGDVSTAATTVTTKVKQSPARRRAAKPKAVPSAAEATASESKAKRTRKKAAPKAA